MEHKSLTVTRFLHCIVLKNSYHTCGGTQLQGSHIPYKVWGDQKSLKVTRFQCCPEKKSYHTCGTQLQGSHISYKAQGAISHWQLQGSCIPYKVWGTIRFIEVKIIILYMWGDPSIPHKVWGTISHWQLSYCTCGGTQLQGSNIPFKAWGTISHWQLQDSCVALSWKNHIVHLEGTQLQGPYFPYKVWGTIIYWQLLASCIVLSWKNHIIHVGETKLQGSHIPYKVWEGHKSLTVIILYMWGTQLQGSCIPYNVWETISHWQLQGSYIALSSKNHIKHVGGGPSYKFPHSI